MPTEVNGEILVNIQTAFGSQAVPVPVTGSVVTVGPPTAITDTTARQPVTTSNVTLKMANPARVGLTIFNNSPGGANLFVKLGVTASITAGSESYTRKIIPGGYYEVPFRYTGQVDAIWDAADANGEALIFERWTAVITPQTMNGVVDWGDAGFGVITSGSNVTDWIDLSGNGNNLVGTTGKPTLVPNVINGQPVVRFGPTATDKFLSYSTPWVAPSLFSTYFVIRLRLAGTYQLMLFLASSPPNVGPSRYLQGTAAEPAVDRPMMYTNNPVAIWSAALADSTNYLVKQAHDMTGAVNSTYYCQVNAAAQVVQTAADNFNPGTITSIGIDPLVVATQDMISDVAEFVFFNRLLGGGEERQLWDYFNSKYALF
jgi:hypothetical protein